jgi:phosphoribosylamine--glycine ligase
MNVLIVGSGAREYSLGLYISKSSKIKKIFFAPGNGATSKIGENVKTNSLEELKDIAINKQIDLSIVGSEASLVEGIVDLFEDNGLTIFGPSKKASKLEGSKDYMKNFLKKYNIPTAKYISSSSRDELNSFVDENFTNDDLIVIKADGLCGGKGVIICDNKDEAKSKISKMLSGQSFGDAGKKVIVEEYLDGYELSLFALCDGKDFKLLPAVQDHKRLLDGDKGPNTGGMGAYAPTPLIDDDMYEEIKQKICIPTLKGMQEEEAPYKGVLFIGLMLVGGKPYVLEYNVRFGDPECQVLMPLLENDILDLLLKASTNRLNEIELKIKDKKSVCIVLASENYPFSSSTPVKIDIPDINDEDIHISYAGVSKEGNDLMASGGRVLCVVSSDDTLKLALDKAYNICDKVNFKGKKVRRDIASQALNK